MRFKVIAKSTRLKVKMLQFRAFFLKFILHISTINFSSDLFMSVNDQIIYLSLYLFRSVNCPFQ